MSSAEHPGGGGNAASNRNFCRQCSTIIAVVPSVGSAHVCPICEGELIEECDRPSPSFATRYRPRVTISRSATFEHRHPRDDFVRVVSESGFFNSPYANWESIATPMPSIGSDIFFWFLKKYLDDCVSDGAKIKSNLHQNEILQLFENFVKLDDLQYVPQFNIVLLREVKITENHVAFNGIGCSICTEDFNIEEEASQLPCEHLYHKDCIARWLIQHKSCPLCRFNLKIYDSSYDKLRAAWIPQLLDSSAASSRDQNTVQPSSGSMATKFKMELLWPIETLFAGFEISSSSDGQGSGSLGEGNSEDSSDNEAS